MNIYRLALAALATVLLSCSKSEQQVLVGDWKMSGQDNQGILILSDGTGMLIDGSRVANYTWSVDFDKVPAHFDWEVEQESGEIERGHFILRMLGENQFQIRGGSDSERPTDFSLEEWEPNQRIYIRRQQDGN
jgi:hypothetical protein